MEVLKHLPEHLSSLTKIISKYSVFIFDMDGVLWSENQGFPEAFKTLNNLSKMDK